MTTFYDALSGQRRKLNLRGRVDKPEQLPLPYCARYGFGHDWAGNWEDEDSKCVHCGVSILFVRVQRNMKRQKKAP